MPRKPKVVEKTSSAEKAKLDWDLIDMYLKAGCSGEDIHPLIGVSFDTLKKRCILDHNMTITDRAKMMYKAGDDSLRMKQYTTAMDGNVPMLVWLGKNRLNQKETPQEAQISAKALESFGDLMSVIKAQQMISIKNDLDENTAQCD